MEAVALKMPGWEDFPPVRSRPGFSIKRLIASVKSWPYRFLTRQRPAMLAFALGTRQFQRWSRHGETQQPCEFRPFKHAAWSHYLDPVLSLAVAAC
jgi:hypothetical protein